ncbi:MAG: hypothetical protein HUK22_07100, partial [Thermoguttaceae bacterium]|nr:hypothetical protein [Thermoguttaceae bacterium]
MRAKSVFQKVFHFCGSIQLAIALMVILAISMGWATFIEREMGSPVAQALIYASNWFYALIAALALNIFFSALARIPRAFTREPDAAGKAKLRFNSAYFPFFMAHVGILVLLVGCWITARSGLQARMIIPEGTAVDSAIDVDSRLFEIEIADFASAAEPRKLTVPFAGGPLNWADVASKKGWEDNVASPVLSTVFAESRAGEFWADLGKSAAKRGQQAARLAAKVALDVKPRTLFDRDGVRLEILDYQTITEYAPVSPLALTLKTPGASRNVELALPGGPDAEPELDPLAESRRAKRQTLEDGWRVVYLLADSQAEFDAFAALAPEPNPDAGKTNADGTSISKTDCVVLVVDGERFQLGLADLAPLSRSGNPAEQRESLEIQRDEIARRLAAEAEVASDAAPSQTTSRDALLESNARLRELSDKLAAAEPSPTAAQAAELRETRAAFMRERTLNYLATAWAQLESATPTSGEFCETLRKMAEQTAERLAEIEKLEKITVLGKTGWQIVGFEVSPTLVSGVEELQGWTATLQLQSPLGELAEASLNSELSERNRLPENGRVFGALWLDTPAGEDSAYGRKWNPALTAPKIEIMQSSNGAATCRFIAGVGDVKTLPIDASVFDGKAAVVEFGAPTLSSVSISQMAAQDEFGVRFVPGAFKKDMANEFYGKAKVRLTLDGRAETFWLRSLPLESVSPEQAKYMVKTFSTP